MFRSTGSDPTQNWLDELMSLEVKSPYASKVISDFNRRKRRSVSALETAIDAYIASEGDSVSKEDFELLLAALVATKDVAQLSSSRASVVRQARHR